MVGAVNHVHFHVLHGVTRNRTGVHGFVQTGVHSVHVLLGNGTTNNLVGNLETGTALAGTHGNHHVTVLTTTTGLLHQLTLHTVSRTGDGFAVGNLGLAGVGLYLELALEAVHDNVEVKLTHTGDDGLTGFLVGLHAEGGVLSGQTLESVGHLLLVGLGKRLHGHGDHGVREGGGLEGEVEVIGGERVTGGGVLQTYDGSDVAGEYLVDVGVNVGLNLQQTPYALSLAGTGVVNGVALADHAGVHTDEDEGAHELVSPELEGKGDRLVLIGGDDIAGLKGLITILVQTGGNSTCHGGELGLERGRKVVNNGIEQALHTLVLEGGTAGHGDELVGDAGATDGGLEGGSIDGLLHEEELSELIVHVGHSPLELLKSSLADLLELALKLLHLVGGAQTIGVAVEDSLLVHNVDLTAELILRTDGDKNRSSVGTELGADVVENVVEVGTRTVHLVDEADAGYLILVGLAPHGLGLGLYAGHTAEHYDSAVEHAQGALHLCGEVHVPGGVDHVELEVLVLEKLAAAFGRYLFPVSRYGGGGNGNTAFLLLFHPVGRRRPFVGLADLVDHAGVEKDALGKRGFATVDVSRDTEVAVALKRGLAVRTANTSHISDK